MFERWFMTNTTVAVSGTCFSASVSTKPKRTLYRPWEILRPSQLPTRK